MKNKILSQLFLFILFVICFACRSEENGIDIAKEMRYCSSQALLTLTEAPTLESIPNAIESGTSEWCYAKPGSWTSGFWPGILWYLYEGTGDKAWQNAANRVTASLLPVTKKAVQTHDIGFITMCSLGNGYRLTGDEEYKAALLRAADSLAVLYNPIVGTILSWPRMVAIENWPHNTIIDNMMNLELLFWAAKNGGSSRLYDIAFRHAEVTMKHGFRDDYTNYHVAVYDTITGNFIKGVTQQGLSDDSMWARGQAWGIYGYTFVYRETQDIRFLEFAQKITDVYLSRLPKDGIPYWDFNASEYSSTEPRDASAAAIVASALLELSTYVADLSTAQRYRREAENMIAVLSSDVYQSRDKNSAFLLHSVGHMPRSREVDTSIIYADYYYIEALIRLQRLQQGKNVIGNK